VRFTTKAMLSMLDNVIPYFLVDFAVSGYQFFSEKVVFAAGKIGAFASRTFQNKRTGRHVPRRESRVEVGIAPTASNIAYFYRSRAFDAETAFAKLCQCICEYFFAFRREVIGNAESDVSVLKLCMRACTINLSSFWL
jgi:hypothetical protein